MIAAIPKPWFKSMTIVATLVATLASWAVSQGFISGTEQESANTLIAKLIETIEHIMAFVAVVGLRRAVAPIQAPTKATGVASGVAIVVLFALGCAHYDRSQVALQADTYLATDEISLAECEGFATASAALVDGPDVTLLGVGRAGELAAMSELLAKQSQVCAETVSRMDIDEELLAQIETAFDLSWTNAREAVTK